MDLGPHATFIWTAYAIVAFVLAGLIFWLLWDGKKLRAQSDDLESRGIKRRSKN